MIHVAKRSVLLALLAGAPLLVGATPAPAPPPVVPVPASAPPPATPPITSSGEVTPFIQPFDLDATQRMAVNVMVEGRGPFSFLVDTGAERTVIARELAERLGLVEGAKLRLATIGSSTVVTSYRVAALSMTGLHMTPFDAPAFAGRHIGAAGLIGVDMLENRRVLIDFRRIEGVSSEWTLDHVRAGQEVFEGEIEAAGFKKLEERDFLKENYFVRFAKIDEEPEPAK